MSSGSPTAPTTTSRDTATRRTTSRHYDLDLDLQGRTATSSTGRATLDVVALDRPRPSSRSTCTASTCAKVTVRRCRASSTARHAQRCASGSREPIARGPSSSGSRSATRGQPQADPRRHSATAGWEELTDGVIVAAPAARRAVVVPVQRPARQQGELPDRRDRAERLPRGLQRRARRAAAAAPATTTWVYEQRRADGDLPRHRADRPLRRASTSTGRRCRSRRRCPHACCATATTRRSAGSPR